MGIDETHLAVDSNNKVHICYHGSLDLIGGTLQYITNASGDWVTSTIDSGDKGLDASIAIDSNNKVHISYLAGTDGTLKYATNAKGHWVTSTIDNKKGVGFNTSIALDSHNKVHISYCDSINISLKYATNAKGHWVKSTIDSTDGVGSTSIAVDSDNKVHIGYYDYGRYLKYATNASGHWITSTIDETGDVGQFSSIAVDSDNKVHISYYDLANHDLKYAVNHPLELLSPNGGEVISVGSTYSIAWSAPSEAVNFRLMYSVNNRKTWKKIHSAPYVTGLSYDWTVPALSNSKNKCLVKITGFDVNGKKLETDMSDATFTIGL
jgi:regulation of enolase protein 1 (concanavalin A-like superfamily)